MLAELILKQPPATAQDLRYFPVIYTRNEDETGKYSKSWKYSHLDEYIVTLIPLQCRGEQYINL